MATDPDRPDASGVPALPSGASDMVPVRAGSPAPPARGTSIVPADLHWHPGLDLPPVGGARIVRWDNPGARRRASVTSFGLTGRLVVTTILVGILAWFVLSGDLFLWAGAVAYLFLLVPALRDTWAPAPPSVPTPPGAARAASRDQTGSPE
jgi:hypothetical protein